MPEEFETEATLFTVGHSSQEIEDYLEALQKHAIQLVCDVRSKPSSFRFPQFNREPLEELLRAAGVRYEFFGESLGGRPADRNAYLPDGRVDYEARRKASNVQTEVDRLVQLSENTRLVLMCAEEDPLQCHRFLMICPEIVERGVAPAHIRRGGTLESQLQAEDRLLKLHHLEAFSSSSLFIGQREAALNDALRWQSREFAFQVAPDALD